MSSEASRSAIELTVAEGLLSGLRDELPRALDTARLLLGDDTLTVREAEERLLALTSECPTCGGRRDRIEEACANCGHVDEADAKADYPAAQVPTRKRRRRRKKKGIEAVEEATVVNNAVVGGSVTGTRTAWGGPNGIASVPGAHGWPNTGELATVPALLTPAQMGATVPPNLRRADGWERCANCVFFDKMCNLYGVERPPVDNVNAWGYPVDRDDLCDSHSSLTPRAARIEEAREELGEALAAADADATVRARARLEQLEEGAFAAGLHRAFREIEHPRGRGGMFRDVSPHELHQLEPGGTLDLGTGVRIHKKSAGEYHVHGRGVGKVVHYDTRSAVHDAQARAHGGTVTDKYGDELSARRAGETRLQYELRRLRHAAEERVEESVLSRLGHAVGFDPKKHPRAPKGRRGGGRFAEKLGKIERAASMHGETAATYRDLARRAERRGRSDVAASHLARAQRQEARARELAPEAANPPRDSTYKPFVDAMSGGIGRRSPGAAGQVDDTLKVDQAIGDTLASFPGLKDWDLSGPTSTGGKKTWALTVHMGDATHTLHVTADGEVTYQDGPDKAKHEAATASVAAKAETGNKPKPKAKPEPTTVPSDLEPTGVTEKPYHMVNGQMFKGHDGKLYEKVDGGPKHMMGKKGPLAGVTIKNHTDGTTKTAPAFALQDYYDLLAAPGSYAPSYGATHEPAGDDVYDALMKSVGGSGGELSGLEGKHVVVTGAIPDHTREQFHAKLKAAGATVHSSVSNKVDILITGKNVGKTKTAAAAAKGVMVVSHEDVMHLLHAAPSDEDRLAAVELALVEAEEPDEVIRLRARRSALERRIQEGSPRLAEVASDAYPGLDRSPKKNWVDKAGGLPRYIERIAKHLHYEKGKEIGHAIAIAVNVVKKMCASGDTNFPGKQSVNPKSRAEACAAVAQWERKKGATSPRGIAGNIARTPLRHAAPGEWLDFPTASALEESAQFRDSVTGRPIRIVPPSDGFVAKLLSEIAAADGPRWWEGMAALDEADHWPVEEGKLSSAVRDKLPDSSFAIPEDRAYPIHDRSHAANALSRASGKPEEGRVRRAVKRKYPDLGEAIEEARKGKRNLDRTLARVESRAKRPQPPPPPMCPPGFEPRFYPTDEGGSWRCERVGPKTGRR